MLGEVLGTRATKETGRHLYSWAGFFCACHMEEYKHAFKLLLFLYFLSTELLLWWLSGKESACQVADEGSTPGREDPLEKEMATHSSILAWRSHGQRSLAGYSPWGCKELHTTERLSWALS